MPGGAHRREARARPSLQVKRRPGLRKRALRRRFRTGNWCQGVGFASENAAPEAVGRRMGQGPTNGAKACSLPHFPHVGAGLRTIFGSVAILATCLPASRWWSPPRRPQPGLDRRLSAGAASENQLRGWVLALEIIVMGVGLGPSSHHRRPPRAARANVPLMGPKPCGSPHFSPWEPNVCPTPGLLRASRPTCSHGPGGGAASVHVPDGAAAPRRPSLHGFAASGPPDGGRRAVQGFDGAVVVVHGEAFVCVRGGHVMAEFVGAGPAGA